MNNYEIIDRLENINDLTTNPQRLRDFIEMGQNIYLVDMDFDEGKRICEKGKKIAMDNTKQINNAEWYELYLLSLKYLARYFNDFDSYMIFLEHNRKPEEQFYLVRRTQLRKLGVVQALQGILDDELDVVTISLPAGVGKSTIAQFFISYYAGLHPEKCNVYSSYSGKMTDMFHRAIFEIITSGEYAWKEIFPDVKIESKSDKDQYINLGKFKNFKTLTCRSIDASTTGVTRAEGILIADDLVEGYEESLNLDRLEKLYNKFLADLYTRRKDGCKVIMIGTRWSVHDPIGRVMVRHEDNPRAKFLSISCYDENGESNFNYKFNKGFSTQYYKDMEEAMKDEEIVFRCMYLSDPIEREGLLYKEEDLQYYLGGLPVGSDGFVKEADAILAVCDTKDTGTDYNTLLVGYVYGVKVYLEDVVYDNGSPYVLDNLNANCLLKNKVQMCQFESNKEGSRTGDEVQKLIEEKNGRCMITKKYTTTNKETRIIVNSDWVKKYVLFKDKSEWGEMYTKFMKDVFRYVQMGKNKHDDSVDALAMLSLFIQGFSGTAVDVMSRRELGI